jgi:anti-anti-sigma regulatory factor
MPTGISWMAVVESTAASSSYPTESTMSHSFEVQVSNPISRTVRVRAAGDVDTAAADALSSLILAAGSAHPTYDVLVDLDEVTLDLDATESLLAAHNELLTEDVRVAFGGLSPAVRQLIDRAEEAAYRHRLACCRSLIVS